MTTITTADMMIAALIEDLDRAPALGDKRRFFSMGIDVELLLKNPSAVVIAPVEHLNRMTRYLNKAAEEISVLAKGPEDLSIEEDARYWSKAYLKRAMRHGQFVEVHNFPRTCWIVEP